MNSIFDWNSPAISPQFTDEFATFKFTVEKSFNRFTFVIVDVKSVSLAKVDAEILDVGWTIIPLF